MSRSSFLYGIAFALGGSAWLAFSAGAAVVCVGPSATGNGSGADWNNQTAWSGLNLSRGNTYYLADGTYSGGTFSTAASGSTYITIKKATVGDSTVESIAGWTSTLGDGQATFTSTCTFSSSYWVFDGVKGALWSTNIADYGFTFGNGAVTHVLAVGGSGTIANITVSHISAIATSADVQKYFQDATGGEVDYFTLSHCFGSGWENFQRASGNASGIRHTGWVTEYNVILNTSSTASWHGEDLNNDPGSPQNWTMRYNWIQGTIGTGPTMVVGALNNDAGPYYIYGNVFKDKYFTDGGICAVKNGYGAHTLSGAVYNNTFINFKSVYAGVTWIGGAGNNTMIAQNNLIVNGYANANNTGGRDYNAYYNNDIGPSEAHGQILPSNPFVSLAANNVQLAYNTAPGVALPAPYNVDALGNVRTTWSRGAFEYNGTPADPYITTQPQNQTVLAGAKATFSVTAGGQTALRYQWKWFSTNVTGATASSWTTPILTTADSGSSVSVAVSDTAGSLTSSLATLTVTGTNVPVIVQQPQSQTVATNDIATFIVAATGASPLSYQWFYNGSPISGATSTSYSSVQYIGDNGATFTVVVSNPDGSTTSAPAVLTVVAQPAPSAPQNLHVVSTQ